MEFAPDAFSFLLSSIESEEEIEVTNLPLAIQTTISELYEKPESRFTDPPARPSTLCKQLMPYHCHVPSNLNGRTHHVACLPVRTGAHQSNRAVPEASSLEVGRFGSHQSSSGLLRTQEPKFRSGQPPR